MPGPRPPKLNFSSLGELYAHFETIFLVGNEIRSEIASDSGLTITVFDHNFFHMVKLRHPSKDKLFMKEEKDLLRAQTVGFGSYEYDPQRAVHLLAVKETLEHPDEVYEVELRTASYIFIKIYEELPYPFTVVLVARRDRSLVVPVTSFTCRRRDVKKWRKGRLIYVRRKNTSAAV
ncbi:MAG: PBECR2 nuclease fold domain-containing protein [Terriglobia bacterium]